MAADGIGGYLELEHYAGEPFHPGAIALNSARNCLAYLIELRGIERIALPNFMCDAVFNVCRRQNVEVSFYEVGEDLGFPGDLEIAQDEWLYLPDYYGRLTEQEVTWARVVSQGRLIVDEVQGFFRKPWTNADTLYTCRKFFGVPDGAYLVTHDGARLSRLLPVGSSRNRMEHVLGRMETCSSEYYRAYHDAEESLGDESLTTMSPVTESLLAAVDYRAAKERRESNYAILKSALDSMNLIDSRSPEGPYMYPLLVEDAGDARSRLAGMGVFVPTLWPNVLEECSPSSWAFRYAKDILPLPVDQRYGDSNMKRIVSAITKCIEQQKGRTA